MGSRKKDNQIYYNPIRRAILNHQLIGPGDKVAIGMSGGKDSTSLFYFLDKLSRQKRLGFDFELVPITLAMGFEMDISPMQQMVEQMGYTLEVVPTSIAQIVFDVRKESAPCSLCAKLRRGILYKRAKEMGCNKVALGHHVDDAIETYFMNFLFHGKMASFEPCSYLTKTDITLIRPLVYLQEQQIIRFVNREELPVIFNPCPVDKKTKREEIKQLITQLAKSYPDIREKFILAIEQGTAENFWTQTGS